LKLVNGTLVGGSNFEDVYTISKDSENDNNMAENQTLVTDKIPTLVETARKVARLQNIELDDKQYIAYKMIASTFLLGLVNDGNDPSTTLYSGLVQTMECSSKKSIETIVRRLKARGGHCFLLGRLDLEKALPSW
jgi:hypothetical protein